MTAKLQVSTVASDTGGQPFPKSRTSMDIFLTDAYTRFRVFPRMPPDQILAYQRTQCVTRFFQEGCLMKATVMGAGGGVLGLVLGAFLFTMRPADVDTTLPLRQQMRQAYKGFGTEARKSMVGFAKIGFLYSLIDCCIARARAKQDIPTALYTGCLTGAALAWRSGPSGMAAGCAGFGAFSAAMEFWSPLGPRPEN